MPFAFLSGLLRSRWSRAGAVGELLERLGEAPGTGGLRELLADALGDRSLRLAYWLDGAERWVDARRPRRRRCRPTTDPARAWTRSSARGERVGAIVHDRSALRGARARAARSPRPRRSRWSNERLEAELRARVEELQRVARRGSSRPALAERRRLERNLHDGAQQRLVALSLHAARWPSAKLARTPTPPSALLAGAREELRLALEELRELARGIHPAVLTDRGLRRALEALAGALADAGRGR